MSWKYKHGNVVTRVVDAPKCSLHSSLRIDVEYDTEEAELSEFALLYRMLVGRSHRRSRLVMTFIGGERHRCVSVGAAMSHRRDFIFIGC